MATPTRTSPPAPAPAVNSSPAPPALLVPARPGQPAPAGYKQRIPAVSPRAGNLLRLDTLAGQFNTLGLLVSFAAVLAALITFFVANSSSENVKSLIKESAPNMVAAQNLAQSFNALDAAAAQLQVARLNGEDKTLLDRARQSFAAQRQSIADALLEARSNISSPGEEEAIRVINSRFYDYIGLLEIMRFELEQGRRESALAQYKAARDILVGNLGNKAAQSGTSEEEKLRKADWKDLKPDGQYLGLEANVEKLARINLLRLNETSQKARDSVMRDYWLIMGGAGLVALVLLALNVRYAIITHRLINPAFFLALLVSLAMLAWLSGTLNRSSDNYSGASRDSVLRMVTASQMKQLMYNLSSTEARLLLSAGVNGPNVQPPLAAAEIRQAFDTKLLEEEFSNRYSLMQARLNEAWLTARSDEERRALCSIADNSTPNGRKCNPDERGPNYAFPEFYARHNQLTEQFNRGAITEGVRITAGPSTSAIEQFQSGATRLIRYQQASFDRSACLNLGSTAFGGNCQGEPGYLNVVRYAGLIVYPVLALMALGGAWYTRRMF